MQTPIQHIAEKAKAPSRFVTSDSLEINDRRAYEGIAGYMQDILNCKHSGVDARFFTTPNGSIIVKKEDTFKCPYNGEIFQCRLFGTFRSDEE